MAEPALNAPVAARKPHIVNSAHGGRLDPYYWLRDDERRRSEVLEYLRAENAYREWRLAGAKGLENQLYEEILARLKQDDATVPYRKRGYWYYTRYEPGKEHPIFARRKDSMEASEQIMLDGNALAVGHDYYQIGGFEVAPGGERLAFFEDTIGRRQYRLRFKNLRTGETLATEIRDVEADCAWANDDRTLIYVEKDPDTLLGLYVKKHTLGADPKDDALVFRQTDKSFYTAVAKSKSERFVFISMQSTVSSEWHYADADDPQLQFKVFAPHVRDHEYQIEHLGDRFIVRTNWQARNFRLMHSPIEAGGDRGAWRDIVAHREDRYIEDFEVFTNFLAVSARSGGLRKIFLHRLGAGAGESCIASDEAAYTTALGMNPDMDGEVLRYAYSSLTTPTSVYDYDVRTGEKRLLKRDPVQGSFDSRDYATEFIEAPADDGRRIPVSLVYRKDFVRNGTAPLLQYAYGAYGASTDPRFSSARLSLLDRGFVYAIAHVRGGQELGRAWYDDGRLLNKMNSFTDFIAVTRFLVARQYAAKDKVFAMGGSAGGLLMGAVANLAPQAYRAIVAQVPFVDVVTTMLDESIPLTTNEYDEWGDPADALQYRTMLSYSPYDNVSAQDYPAMLVTTGLWDSQVQYYEPVKWVAKLRALKTDGHLLALYVDMESGHGGKAGRFQRYREVAMEYAFMLDQLRDV